MKKSVLIILFLVFSPLIQCLGQVNPEISKYDFNIQELLDTKISTASKYEQKAKDSPNSVSIISADDIARYGYRTLYEALEAQTGFFLRNDLNYSYLGLRGLDRPSSFNANVLILLNGHIINDNIFSSVYLANDLGLDFANIERIEIIKGPGSTLYGNGAILSIINIITKTPKSIDGAILSVDYGSLDTRRLSITFGKKLFDKLDILISGHWGDTKGADFYFREFDDSANNYGIAKGLDWENYRGAYLSMAYEDFSLQCYFNNRKKGVPTASYQTDFNSKDEWTLDERSFLELSYNKPINDDKNIYARAYYDYYYYTGTYPISSIIQQDDDYGKWIGAEARFLWDFSEANRLIIGSECKNNIRADYRLWERLSLRDSFLFDNNFPFSVYSAFFQDSYQLLYNFLITLGLRFDSYSNSSNSLSPRFSIIYNPEPESTLKFVYSKAFRTPNIYEMYYTDYQTAKDNPDLLPEKIHAVEAIYIKEFEKHFYAGLSLYGYFMNDLIEQVIDTDSLAQFRNISEVAVYGLELELKGQLRKNINFYLSYAAQNAKNNSDGKRLTNSPEHVLKAGISFKFFDHVVFSFESRYESERLTIYGTKTKPLFLSDLNFMFSSRFSEDDFVKTLANHFSFSLKANNVFNKYYEFPGNNENIQNTIPQYGRTINLELSVRI